MLEVYSRIDEYPNYAISNIGNVINIKKNGKLLKANSSNGYVEVELRLNGKRKTAKIHRLMASAFLNKYEGKNIVDHIDGNPLNNCLDNLRYCTYSENNMNRKKSSKNSSGVKGVLFNKSTNKWQAYININKKQCHIGYYKTLEEASKARKLKALEVFGEFLNDDDK